MPTQRRQLTFGKKFVFLLIGAAEFWWAKSASAKKTGGKKA